MRTTYNQIINSLQERSKPRRVNCEIFFARGENRFDVDFSALLLNREARVALGPIGLSGRLSLVLVHNIKSRFATKKGTVLPGKFG